MSQSSTENGPGSPGLLQPGRNGRSLWAGWGWGCMPLSWLVAIAIRPSDKLAKALRHIGDFAPFRRDGKGSALLAPPPAPHASPDRRAVRGPPPAPDPPFETRNSVCA